MTTNHETSIPSRPARPEDGREALAAKVESDRRMVLIWEQWAKNHGEDGGQLLFRRVATHLAAYARDLSDPAVALVDRARLAQLEADAARLDEARAAVAALARWGMVTRAGETELDHTPRGQFVDRGAVLRQLDAARQARAGETEGGR